ncbi:MAG: hypothetical protein R2695_14925 [Acidimicrobiales bacterium]
MSPRDGVPPPRPDAPAVPPCSLPVAGAVIGASEPLPAAMRRIAVAQFTAALDALGDDRTELGTATDRARRSLGHVAALVQLVGPTIGGASPGPSSRSSTRWTVPSRI